MSDCALTRSTALAVQSNRTVFSGPFSRIERSQEIAKASQKIYDLCIIGGGITGAAVARDAVLRGLSVLLVEKNDFAYGTSSRSSKLVHGGLRYLEQYEFKLVMESTRERARLWKLAPDLVSPLPFLFPSYKKDRVPLWKLSLGLWLYDILAKFQLPSLHKLYLKKRTLQEEPGLNDKDLKGAIFYWDGSTNDALLTLSNIVDSYQLGASPLSRVRVEGINWNNNVSEGAPHLIQLKDELQKKNFQAQARVIVCAAGPWTDEFLSNLAPRKSTKNLLAPTRGSHIVVSQKRLPTKHAMTLIHPLDGRILFSIPWGETTILGTTDLFDAESPDQTAINSDEIRYLLDAANHYFPHSRLETQDVLSTWSGLRPLLAPPDHSTASNISREHHIEFDGAGFIVIAGGKLTTHREMAEEAVDKLLRATLKWKKPLVPKFISTRTLDRPLPSFEYPRKGLEASPRLGQSEASHFSFEDIRGLCKSQMVLSLEDLFVRRTALFYKEADNGWSLLPLFKDVLCEELSWDKNEWENQVSHYRSYIEKHVLKPLKRNLDLK